MDTKAVIISGEAPESDDESSSIKTGLSFPSVLASGSCGTIIQGEARESDDETNSVASYVVDPATCSYVDVKHRKSEKSCVKYNSLLHKKLRECNKSLNKNIHELLSTTVTSAMEQLVDTNKQLVKSELVLQDTVSKLQIASTHFESSLETLSQIVDEDYFQTVKI
ncbi:hypothetical protein QAD02_019268 [Eretmocerus hayati]|uniref:Uncharacterized protein n=1 Tax=Eretmocerus hayati TaxID=131215 RepID=A0ACC2PKB8_9HYME|nr:hypothetical protein QAD02_019268 [Eretmocerus hayati]